MNGSDSMANPLMPDFPTQLKTVFRSLRTGKHLCIDDGIDFRDLRKNEYRYEAIFSALGYRLVRHQQNFFYFSGGNQLNTKRVRSITLFLLILYQYLEDRKSDDAGQSWVSTLTNRTFKIDDLPHFSTPAFRSWMLRLDVNAENVREKVLREMSRLGIIEYSGNATFSFRSPVYRFIDLCIEFSQREEPVVPVSHSEVANSEAEEIWVDVDDEVDDNSDADLDEDFE